MRTIYPSGSDRHPKIEASSKLPQQKQNLRWYSFEYVSSVWAKRPAKVFAALAFIGVAALLISAFAAGVPETSLWGGGSGATPFNGSGVTHNSGVQVSSDGTKATLSMVADQPLDKFGASSGYLSDATGTTLSTYLAGAKKVLGSGGYVRTALKWDPTKSDVSQNWPKYDDFLTQVYSSGLVWLPEINNESSSLCSGSTVYHYAVPNLSTGGGWDIGLREIADRYGPGGTFAQAHPGFTGITTFEIWNEPDTVTGNALSCHQAGQLDPGTADGILRVGANALHSEAGTKGWTAHVIGGVLGSIDLTYLGSMYTADSHVLSYLDDLSIHMYMHDNLDDPSNACIQGTSTNERCVTYMTALRTWMDGHGGQTKKISITEGGYSGSNDPQTELDQLKSYSRTVFSEAQQASLDKDAIQWMRSHPELKMDILTLYHPDDNGMAFPTTLNSTTADQYWQQHLGAYLYPSLALKPWGTKYQKIVDCYQGLVSASCSGI